MAFGLTKGVIGLSAVLCGICNAQVVEVSLDAPSLDRWNYPFNGSPGSRLSASTFGAVELAGFDDHDAQLVLGFDVSAQVASGLDASQYDIISACVIITNTNGDEFRYDPSYDGHETYLFLDESLDTDMGRPIHLWGVGYRNGYDASSWGEYTVFGGVPTVEPAQGARHAFACDFPSAGVVRDVSNNLKQEFDPMPMAIGQVDGLGAGELVPADTDFVFDVDVCDPGFNAFIASGVSNGEVRFVVSSLTTANGGKGGGTGDIQYPFWYTRENPIGSLLGYAPRLELRVRVGSAGDYNNDGVKDIFDVFAYLDDFNAGSADADLQRDCVFDVFDVFAFLNAFNS